MSTAVPVRHSEITAAQIAQPRLPDPAEHPLLVAAMLRIRRVEEAIAAHYSQQRMRCPVHLSIGQEASAVGVCAALGPQDQVVSTHRAHAHYLAKGGNLSALIAELHGKQGGCSGGRGGSMHLSDRAAGFLASTAIVGNSIPVGVGAALAFQLANQPHLCCIFLGDGAVEEGVFYESANFAVVRNLPVLFVCENNLYSVYSPLEKRQPKKRVIADMAAAMGLAALQADGNDVQAVTHAARQVVGNIRSGKGPAFLELSTYRWLEHCGPLDDDHLGYRPAGELAQWKQSDPLHPERIGQVVPPDQLMLLESRIAAEIAQAFASAAAAPFPAPAFGPQAQYASGPWINP